MAMLNNQRVISDGHRYGPEERNGNGMIHFSPVPRWVRKIAFYEMINQLPSGKLT